MASLPRYHLGFSTRSVQQTASGTFFIFLPIYFHGHFAFLKKTFDLLIRCQARSSPFHKLITDLRTVIYTRSHCSSSSPFSVFLSCVPLVVASLVYIFWTDSAVFWRSCMLCTPEFVIQCSLPVGLFGLLGLGVAKLQDVLRRLNDRMRRIGCTHTQKRVGCSVCHSLRPGCNIGVSRRLKSLL